MYNDNIVVFVLMEESWGTNSSLKVIIYGILISAFAVCNFIWVAF